MQYTFVKTTTHYVTINADTQAEAEAQAAEVLTIDDEVSSTTDEDWELVKA